MRKIITMMFIGMLAISTVFADVYVRKIENFDGKWFDTEITVEQYDWYRENWFKSDKEVLGESMKRVNSKRFMTSGGLHTELDFDKEVYPNAKRMKLIRYYTEEK